MCRCEGLFAQARELSTHQSQERLFLHLGHTENPPARSPASEPHTKRQLPAQFGSLSQREARNEPAHHPRHHPSHLHLHTCKCCLEPVDPVDWKFTEGPWSKERDVQGRPSGGCLRRTLDGTTASTLNDRWSSSLNHAWNAPVQIIFPEKS